MRQVNIKTLRANLSAELSNLPFAITKKGEIIAVVGVHLADKADKKIESSVHHIEAVKKQLTKIIKKKAGVHQSEADVPTEETPVFGYPKSYQTRKKKEWTLSPTT